MTGDTRQDPTTPVPVPTGPDAPRFILIFGGTFDPPHKGHIELPVRVRDELERRGSCPGRGWLLYVPAARSPLKADSPVASDKDRLEMLRLALAESQTPRASIWTDELDRAAAASRAGQTPPPSYTVETLGRLRAWLDVQNLGGVELRLLIGADQALSFERWRQPRDILRLAKPAVMARGDVGDAERLVKALAGSGYWNAGELRMWREAAIPVGAVDISATRVREALATGSSDAIRTLIPRAVVEFVRSRRLYSSG